MEPNQTHLFAQWLADAIEAHATTAEFAGLPVIVDRGASDKNIVCIQVGEMRYAFNVTVNFAQLMAATG